MPKPSINWREVRELAAWGLTPNAIAAKLGCARSSVHYILSEKYRNNQRSRQNSKRVSSGVVKPSGFQPKQQQVDWPVYDGGDVWVEDRMIKPVGVGTEDREEAKRRIERTGSPRSSRADNRCESLVEPVEASPRYIPGFLLAQDKYFAALGTPAADGLRREWMASMGRA